jgi:hypothetical protein
MYAKTIREQLMGDVSQHQLARLAEGTYRAIYGKDVRISETSLCTKFGLQGRFYQGLSIRTGHMFVDERLQ